MPSFSIFATRRTEWIGLIGIASLICALHARYCLSRVIGRSMVPTLSSGDLLLVDKWAYAKGDPKRGDIVVGHFEKDLIVKRIIGLPGEDIEIREGALYVNGKLISEPYIANPTHNVNISRGNLFPERYATIGDNRGIESRYMVHPILSKRNIVGRAIFLINFWPLHVIHVDVEPLLAE